MKVRSLIIVVLLVAFGVTIVYGQSPMINYQGKVTDSGGQPLDGTYSIQFNIYGQETGGTALWTEIQSSVVVENGIFNVLLGRVNPIPTSLFDGNSRWLGLKVENDTEMSPRQRIVSVGYALRADKANEADYADNSDKLDGQHASAFATATHNHDADYVDEGQINSVTTGMIMDGTIQQGDLSFAVPDGHSLDAADGSPVDALYVDNEGHVGIGTKSPAAKLQIAPSAVEIGLRIGGLAGANGWAHFEDAGGFTYEVGADAGPPGFHIYRLSSGQGDFIIDKDGEVGIGTTNPGAKLEIQGTEGIRTVRVLNTAGTAVVRMGPNNQAAGVIDLYNSSGTQTIEFHANSTNPSFFNAGNVGIGTNSPSHPLHMGSGAHCTAGGVWTDASSVEYKENVTELKTTEAMEALDDLTPVTFNYKVDKDEKHVGFIAEDVPELVATQDRKGLSPMDIVAVLTKVVQEQQKMSQEQEERIAVLERRIAKLEKR